MSQLPENLQITERFVRLPEVKSMTGLSRTTIYLRMGQGSFPKSYAIGKRAKGWKFTEIGAWMNERSQGGAA